MSRKSKEQKERYEQYLREALENRVLPGTISVKAGVSGSPLGEVGSEQPILPEEPLALPSHVYEHSAQ